MGSLAWARAVFWDGRARSLEEQALAPIQSADEMAQSLDDLVAQLARDPAIVASFRAAFPEAPGVTAENAAAYLPHCAARAEAADDGSQRRMMVAVGAINPLDHLLTPFVLEIDVDVGRLAALLGDEALEQEVAGRGVDRRHAQRIADRAVRG